MAFANKMLLVLSETKKVGSKNKHVEVGRKLIPIPSLFDFGIQQKQAIETEGENKGKPQYDDGIPVFDDPRFDWLQQAIAAKVAATVRNRFKGGELKPGATLPEDFDQLTAETVRTGEALALRRDAKASFEAYLQSQNKKAATVQVLGELFWNSSKVLSSAGEKYVEALSAHVGKWIDTLKEEQKARFSPKIAELQESINNAQEGATLDDEDLAA